MRNRVVKYEKVDKDKFRVKFNKKKPSTNNFKQADLKANTKVV